MKLSEPSSAQRLKFARLHTPTPPEVDPDRPPPTSDPDPQPDDDPPSQPTHPPEGDPPSKPPPVQALCLWARGRRLHLH